MPVTNATKRLAPPGTITAFGGTVAPAGWLECNGQSVSRVTYAALFAAIGTTWGAADGASFNLPDARGEFLRGADGGRGVDAGRLPGSSQTDAFKQHDHPIKVGTSDGSAGYVNGGLQPIAGGQFRSQPAEQFMDYRGGSETRPRNIAVIYCIKT